MVLHLVHESAVGAYDPAAPSPVSQRARGLEAEHLKEELRNVYAPLESAGLLAAAVRLVLELNGFGPPATLRQHCGCPSCARNCPVCAARRSTEVEKG